MKDQPNFHIMWYEQMKADLDKEVESLQQFLGTDLDKGQMAELKRRVQIDSMQKHAFKGMAPFSKFFNRKGQAGTPENALKNDPKIISEWKEWLKENLDETDLPINIF